MRFICRTTLVSLFSVLVLTGCDSMMSKSDYYDSDEYLISQIKDAANKVQIEYNQLPEDAITTIETSYSSEVFINKMCAVELGYELTMGDTNLEEGFSKIYFNLEGRKLVGKDYDKWDCFDFVYPVTFIMSDGSHIAVTSNDEEGWEELKSWFDQNPNVEFEWNLEYPVDIVLEDGSVLTVNTDQEIIDIKENCEY
tara:strand:- start:763 stop:1350 length:588 start_codon:yes stop_codon:yes gene_type:complete